MSWHGPTMPDTRCPLAVAELVTPLATPVVASTNSHDLQASSNGTVQTKQNTGSQQVGRQTQSHETKEHTTLQSSRNSQACLLTTMQAKWYNIKCSHMTTLIYPITNSASILMIAPRSSPTSVGTWLQSAQGTATGPRQNIGSLVPVLPPAKPVPVATPSNSIEIPTTTPPQEEFLPTETTTASFCFGNLIGLHVCSEGVLITEIGRGDPFCLLDRIPLPQHQKLSSSSPGC